MRKILFLLLVLCAQTAFGSSKYVKITGELPTGFTGASFYSVRGFITRGTVSGKKFSIPVPSKNLKDGWVFLLKNGNQFGGTVVLAQNGPKSFLQFASNSAKSISLGSIANLSKGYLKLKKPVSNATYDKNAFSKTSLLGAPFGLNRGAYAVKKNKGLGFAKIFSTTPGDADGDGVPDGIDVDAHGSGSVDALTVGATTASSAGVGVMVREGMQYTINSTATGIPSASAIDNILTTQADSEFVMGFGASLPPNVSGITGGHIVCDPSDTLCGINAGLATVNSMGAGLWINHNTDGTQYPGLDFQSGPPAFFQIGIEPHVGPSVIRPGQTYEIDFTGAGASVLASELVTVSPYLVTIPAINTYTTQNVTNHLVDYSSISSEPGASMGSPIAIGSDGLLTVTFWRPQRQGIAGADSSAYVDVGHMRYGIIIEGPVGGGGGGGQQTGCGGYYSAPSSNLTNTGASGPNDTYTLNDSADDASPSASNTLTFTVDLKGCITTKAGLSSGRSYLVTLGAAGPELSTGTNSSGQDFTISLP